MESSGEVEYTTNFGQNRNYDFDREFSEGDYSQQEFLHQDFSHQDFSESVLDEIENPEPANNPEIPKQFNKGQFNRVTNYIRPDISVAVWTWNVQSIRLAESLDPEVLQQHRAKTQDGWLYSSEIPDFWPGISQYIAQINPTICVFGFQEDAFPGSYFHSHFLPTYFEPLGYRLFKRVKNMGIGKTSYQGLLSMNPCLRGLRTSVYIRNDMISKFRLQYSPIHYNDSYFYNKGAVAIYVTLPNEYGGEDTLAIMNVHLPMNSPSLSETVTWKDQKIREDQVLIQDMFLNAAYRKCILQAPANPKFVIVCGDLNYRFAPCINWSAKLTGEHILQSLPRLPFLDEFQESMRRGNIYSFEEGVNNVGPTFAPTCKMSKTRTAGNTTLESYSCGKQDQRVPSYADRILYNNRNVDPSKQIFCQNYDRWDFGVMVKSDHAGVFGEFIIRYL